MLKKYLYLSLIFSFIVSSLFGYMASSSPLLYKYSGNDTDYALIESTSERLGFRNWTKFNLHAIDGKYPESDNSFGNTVPTKVNLGEHTIQLRITTMIAEGISQPTVLTFTTTIKVNLLPIKYKVKGSTFENKVWLETEQGIIVSPKIDLDFTR